MSLKDADISLRRRALDLLYAICHQSNAEVRALLSFRLLCCVATGMRVQEIVKELLTYLITAEFAIKDEMVLKTAILAERYAPNLQWYVDTMLQLINVAGDHISDDIWHRTVRIVTNNPDLQGYAARKMYKYVMCCTVVGGVAARRIVFKFPARCSLLLCTNAPSKLVRTFLANLGTY